MSYHAFAERGGVPEYLGPFEDRDTAHRAWTSLRGGILTNAEGVTLAVRSQCPDASRKALETFARAWAREGGAKKPAATAPAERPARRAPAPAPARRSIFEPLGIIPDATYPLSVVSPEEIDEHETAAVGAPTEPPACHECGRALGAGHKMGCSQRRAPRAASSAAPSPIATTRELVAEEPAPAQDVGELLDATRSALADATARAARAEEEATSLRAQLADLDAQHTELARSARERTEEVARLRTRLAPWEHDGVNNQALAELERAVGAHLLIEFPELVRLVLERLADVTLEAGSLASRAKALEAHLQDEKRLTAKLKEDLQKARRRELPATPPAKPAAKRAAPRRVTVRRGALANPVATIVDHLQQRARGER